jgi:hypothetical protein
VQNDNGQWAGIERRARVRFSRTVEASRMSRAHMDAYIRFGNSEGIDAALEAMFLADQAQLDAMDAHEAWREAQADLAADQTASAREAL